MIHTYSLAGTWMHFNHLICILGSQIYICSGFITGPLLTAKDTKSFALKTHRLLLNYAHLLVLAQISVV